MRDILERSLAGDFTITAESLLLHPLTKCESAVADFSIKNARVAKLVDALASGASAARRGGSSPFSGTSEFASLIISERHFLF